MSATSPTQRLFQLLKVERTSLWAIAVYAITVGVISLAAPLGVQAMVSAIAFGGLRQPLVVLALLVLGALSFAALVRALQWTVAERIQERIFTRAAFDVTVKVAHARRSALHGSHPREFVNRFFDVVTVQKGAAVLLVDGIYILLQAGVGAAVLTFYHPYLLAYAVVLILSVVTVVWPFGRQGAATALEESKAKYAVVAWFEEIASHPTAFRSVEGEAFAEARSHELTHNYLRARRTHFKVVFRQGVAFFALQAVATAALLGVGGFLVLEGKISLGQLVAAEIIVTAVTGAFSKFGKYLESYYDLLAALDKVGYLTDIPLESAHGETLPIISEWGKAGTERRPILALNGVSFEVDGREVISGATFAVHAGEHLALLAPNGTGKSALLDLLWGMEEPTAGTVEVFGVPLRDLDVRRVRDEVTLARVEELFDGTIADNLRVGRRGMGAADLRIALETVGLWDEIAQLPGGLTSPARGAGLSDGQVRRLLLARAIARKPRVVLIDGVLDGLDRQSRSVIAAGLFAPNTPWTVLIATHSPAVAELAMRTSTLTARPALATGVS